MKLFSQILLFSVLEKIQSQIFKIQFRFLMHWDASHRLKNFLAIHRAISLFFINLFA